LTERFAWWSGWKILFLTPVFATISSGRRRGCFHDTRSNAFAGFMMEFAFSGGINSNYRGSWLSVSYQFLANTVVCQLVAAFLK
jgi:hypothetical protein